jgi:hypothetical protein
MIWNQYHVLHFYSSHFDEFVALRDDNWWLLHTLQLQWMDLDHQPRWLTILTNVLGMYISHKSNSILVRLFLPLIYPEYIECSCRKYKHCIPHLLLKPYDTSLSDACCYPDALFIPDLSGCGPWWILNSSPLSRSSEWNLMQPVTSDNTSLLPTYPLTYIHPVHLRYQVDLNSPGSGR